MKTIGDIGEARLAFGERVGEDPGRTYADWNSPAYRSSTTTAALWDRSEFGEPERNLAVHETGLEVIETCVRRRRRHVRQARSCVVADRQRGRARARLLAGEPPRIAFVDVDDDLDRGEFRFWRRCARPRPGIVTRGLAYIGRAGGLPEDRLPTAGIREDELGPALLRRSRTDRSRPCAGAGRGSRSARRFRVGGQAAARWQWIRRSCAARCPAPE